MERLLQRTADAFLYSLLSPCFTFLYLLSSRSLQILCKTVIVRQFIMNYALFKVSSCEYGKRVCFTSLLHYGSEVFFLPSLK